MTPTKKKDSPPSNAIAALTKASILKITGKKTVEPVFSTLPHVDSGSILINALIGGNMATDGKGMICPGYPRRKMTEIFGPESSGKTSIALAAAVEVQRKGGTVMFLDFEHALHHGYAKTIGLKFDDTFLLFEPDTMEEGWKMVYVAISSGVDLVIVDSVASMVPVLELDKKLDEAAKVGVVAAKMAQTLPKVQTWLATFPKTGSGDIKKTDPTKPGTALILLNQERATISTGGYGGGGDTTNTTGGKAMKYYMALRLRFQRIGSETIERVDRLTGKKKKFPYGNKTTVKVVKNKLDGKQGHSGEFFIRYGFGLDNYYSIIETGCANGIVKKEGAYYQFGETRIQGRDKFMSFLVENPKVFEDIVGKVTVALSAAGTAVKEEDISPEDELLAEFDLDDDTSLEVTNEVVDTSDALDEVDAETT